MYKRQTNLIFKRFFKIKSTPPKPTATVTPTHNTADNLNTNGNGNGNGGSLMNVKDWKEKNATIAEATVKADRHSTHADNDTEKHIAHLQKITTIHFETKLRSPAQPGDAQSQSQSQESKVDKQSDLHDDGSKCIREQIKSK